MLRAICDHSLDTPTWSDTSKITQGETYRIMKRTDKTRGSRRHAIVKMLTVLAAIIAIFGPTLLVVTDAWAKGPGSGSGASGGGNAGGNGGGNREGGGN